MTCRKCKKSFADELNYCPHCGTPARKGLKPHVQQEEAHGQEMKSNHAPQIGGVRRVNLNLSPEFLEAMEEEPVESQEVEELQEAQELHEEQEIQSEPTPTSINMLPPREEEVDRPAQVKRMKPVSKPLPNFMDQRDQEVQEKAKEHVNETLSQEALRQTKKHKEEEPTKQQEEVLVEKPEETAQNTYLLMVRDHIFAIGVMIIGALSVFFAALGRGLKHLGKYIRIYAGKFASGFHKFTKNAGDWSKETGKRVRHTVQEKREDFAKHREIERERKLELEAKAREEAEREALEAPAQEDTVRYQGFAESVERQLSDRTKEDQYSVPPRMEKRSYAQYQALPVSELAYEDEFEVEEPSGEVGLGRKIYNWLAIRVRPFHFALLILLVLALLALPLLNSLRSPTKAFQEALDSRDYDRAAEVYVDRYEGKEDLEEASLTVFREHLSTLKQNAISGGTSFSATNAAIEVMRESDLYTGGYRLLMDETVEELMVLQQADVLYNSALDKYNRLDFAGAIQDFNRVQEATPAYRDTVDLLARSRDRYRENVISQVNSLQSQRNFQEALTRIDRALELLGDDPMLLNLRESTVSQSESALFEQTSTEAERLFQTGNTKGVLEVIEKALAQEPQDASLLQLKETYETKVAEQILNVADELFLRDEKEEALNKLNEGLELMPEHSLLLEAQERYELESQETNGSETSTTPGAGGNVDAGGTPHPNAYVHQHTFTGNLDLVDRITLSNDEDKQRISGSISLGPVDTYTQVYFQVYALSNPNTAIRYGALVANAGDVSSFVYTLDMDTAIYGSDVVVTLNYLYGNEIDVIIDLGFTD